MQLKFNKEQLTKAQLNIKEIQVEYLNSLVSAMQNIEAETFDLNEVAEYAAALEMLNKLEIGLGFNFEYIDEGVKKYVESQKAA